MASITAKTYLTKVNKICKSYDIAGECSEKCPIKKYGCGTPLDEDQIDTVIELVRKYKPNEAGKCKCGRDNTELIDNHQNIKFCPYCGTALDCEVGKCISD